MYNCAKVSSWGDRLPVDLISQDDESSNGEEQNLDSTKSEDEKTYESVEDKVEGTNKEEKKLYSKAPCFTKTYENL